MCSLKPQSKRVLFAVSNTCATLPTSASGHQTATRRNTGLLSPQRAAGESSNEVPGILVLNLNSLTNLDHCCPTFCLQPLDRRFVQNPDPLFPNLCHLMRIFGPMYSCYGKFNCSNEDLLKMQPVFVNISALRFERRGVRPQPRLIIRAKCQNVSALNCRL